MVVPTEDAFLKEVLSGVLKLTQSQWQAVIKVYLVYDKNLLVLFSDKSLFT